MTSESDIGAKIFFFFKSDTWLWKTYDSDSQNFKGRVTEPGHDQ